VKGGKNKKAQDEEFSVEADNRQWLPAKREERAEALLQGGEKRKKMAADLSTDGP